MTSSSTSRLTMIHSSEADAAALYETSSAYDIVEKISAMRRRETSSAYRPVDYLRHYHRHHRPSSSSSSSSSTVVAKEDDLDDDDHEIARSKMCDWCYQLTDACSLSRHAVVRSMNYLDRFVAASVATEEHHQHQYRHPHLAINKSLLLSSDRREYQLAAMTALYVSVKIHEPLAMDASLLAEISAGCYTTSEFLAMERKMLDTLRWNLHAPTSKEFVCLLLGLLLLLPLDDPEGGGYYYGYYGCDLDLPRSLLDVASFQCELAALDYELSNSPCFLPSEIALGSVLNALEGITDCDVLSDEARYAYLGRICRAFAASCDDGGVGCGIDMERIGIVQSHLRRAFRENVGPPAGVVVEDEYSSRRRRGRHEDEIIPQEDKIAPRSSSSCEMTTTTPSCVAKCVSPATVARYSRLDQRRDDDGRSARCA